jgi:hypothetical protein
MKSNATLIALALGLILVAVASFVLGRSLKSSDNTVTVELDAPAYEAAKGIAGLSEGGFTGFGEVPGLAGQTVLAGRIVSLAPTSITIESAAGVRSTIQVSSESALRRIETTGREALTPGTTVVVRRDSAGEAKAVLVLAQP